MTQVPTRSLRPLLLVLLLVAFVSGCSTSPQTGRYSLTVVTQQDHTLQERESLVGDTVVAGGTLALREGAEHRGSVTILAGDVRIGGRVVGDLMVLGGTATLTGTAEITGDVTAAGGIVTRDPGALVRGDVTEEPGLDTVMQRSDDPRSPAESVLWSLAGVAVLAGLAWLVASLAPRPLHRTEAAATGFPVVSGALGGLVLITALPLMVSMVFTLILIPVAGIVLLGLAATAVFGVVATGYGVGIRVVRRLGWSWPTPRTAALGTAVLVTLLQLVGLVPVVGVALVGITLVVCVGAVFLTRFGLRWHTPPEVALEAPGSW
jgi:hypothetical protein